jgi:hypothetical protein
MARLNLTLPDDTFVALSRDARKAGAPVATHARRLLGEALVRRGLLERRRVWAEAYRSDRADARQLATDLELGTLELLDDEGA